MITTYYRVKVEDLIGERHERIYIHATIDITTCRSEYFIGKIHVNT